MQWSKACSTESVFTVSSMKSDTDGNRWDNWHYGWYRVLKQVLLCPGMYWVAVVSDNWVTFLPYVLWYLSKASQIREKIPAFTLNFTSPSPFLSSALPSIKSIYNKTPSSFQYSVHQDASGISFAFSTAVQGSHSIKALMLFRTLYSFPLRELSQCNQTISPPRR